MWFKSKKRTPTQVLGVSLTQAGCTCCLVNASGTVSAFTYDLSKQSLADALVHAVREHDLKGAACHVVLSGDDYKMLTAEAPQVPPAEMNQALLWSLRDVLDAKPEDTVLESFPFATGITRPGKLMRQVVATRRSHIQTIVNAVLNAGLQLESIDIPELALRNIMARLPENEQGTGLVSQGTRGVSVTLYRGGELYVTRQLAGIANLAEASHPLTAPRLTEQLGLELLRTLDYYDSQLQQRPPAAIFLQPLPGVTTLLLEGLSAMLRLPTRQLQFDDVVEGAQTVAVELQAQCFTALGAVLRAEVG